MKSLLSNELSSLTELNLSNVGLTDENLKPLLELINNCSNAISAWV